MTEAPLVTTVIATYSRAGFLGRAIRSALQQTERRLRVAVYDNASPDATRAVVESIQQRDDRVTYARHATNIGASANYNHGIARVTTPYFSLLGDDDVLLPALYERAVAALERHPECAFFCARTVADNRHAGVLMHRGSWPAGLYAPSVDVVERMIRDHFINTAVVFRRSIVESIGYFDHLGSDRNYIVLAAATHPFIVSGEELGVMTIHDRSFSGGGATTDFGSGTLHSWGGRYAIESHRELAAALSAKTFAPAELEVLTNVLAGQTRRELLYICATAPDAARWTAALRETLAVADEVRLRGALRLLLRILAAASSHEAAARILHAAARALWRTTARLRVQSEADRAIRGVLNELERDENLDSAT